MDTNECHQKKKWKLTELIEHDLQSNDYQRQNNLILEILRQGLGDDGFEILDAYYLNVLRPDEHRAHQGDCLHNCYPGKMDVYNQLLLHYLRAQRTADDVDYLKRLNDPALRGGTVQGNITPQVLQWSMHGLI